MLKSQGQSVPPKQVAAAIVGKLENTEPFLEKVSVHMWLQSPKPVLFPGSSDLGMRLSPVLAGYTHGKLINKAFITILRPQFSNYSLAGTVASYPGRS